MARLLTKCMADLTVSPFSGVGAFINTGTLDSGQVLNSNGGDDWLYSVPGSPNEIFFGAFWRQEANLDSFVIEFYNSSNLSIGKLRYFFAISRIALMNSAGTLLATATIPCNVATPYHFQIHLKTSTIFQLKIDDVVALTYNAGLGSDISAIHGREYARWDAMIINNVVDPGDGTNMSWPGIRRLKIQLPVFAGHYTDWLQSAVGNPALLVDNTPPNASEYVYTQLNAQSESFSIAPHTLPTLAAVRNVIEQFYTYKNTDGQIKIGARIGGADYLSGALDIGVAGKIYQYLMNKNPATGIDWTQPDLNAVEALMQSVI